MNWLHHNQGTVVLLVLAFCAFGTWGKDCARRYADEQAPSQEGKR